MVGCTASRGWKEYTLWFAQHINRARPEIRLVSEFAKPAVPAVKNLPTAPEWVVTYFQGLSAEQQRLVLGELAAMVKTK